MSADIRRVVAQAPEEVIRYSRKGDASAAGRGGARKLVPGGRDLSRAANMAGVEEERRPDDVGRTGDCGCGSQRPQIVIEGEAEVTISGIVHRVNAGQLLMLPANQPHGLKAVTRFKMILVMIKIA